MREKRFCELICGLDGEWLKHELRAHTTDGTFYACSLCCSRAEGAGSGGRSSKA